MRSVMVTLKASMGVLMRFQTRSKEAVVADLNRKLEQLPERHPARPVLVRMLCQLNAEVERAAERETKSKAEVFQG